jgi:hypothetical protein
LELLLLLDLRQAVLVGGLGLGPQQIKEQAVLVVEAAYLH